VAEAPTLRAFVAQLKQAELDPRPPAENWPEHVERISHPGRITAVSEEQYDYWLECLPPKWMANAHFCFAEGAEAFRLFWFDRAADRYLARQLTWEETVTFCRLAGLPRPW
jgi:hypothetical protein